MPALAARFLKTFERMALALLAVALIGLLRWALSPLLFGQGALILFIPAVMLSTWYGGRWTGLAAMAFAVIVGESAQPHPVAVFQPENHQFLRAILFLAVGLQIVLTTDLLHRRTLEARAASRAKDLFISILSHELRTPLTPAALIASSLAADTTLPDTLREQAGIIQRNIGLEVRLIDDLLDISRIQKGKLTLVREIVDVERSLREALQICRPSIDAKHLQIRVHVAGGPHHINADPARLQQIFWNLLRNAVKFTPDGGTISINITADECLVSIQISDTGIGIAPAALSRIFQPFEQASDSIMRQFGGLGLGLAITRALVGLHGGKIHAASEGLGRGATFIVQLPLSAFVPASPESTAPRALPARSLHILFVEDHPDTLLVMVRLLEQFGHHVTPASSVAQALACADREPFDLLLTDLSLPDGTGIELLTRLRGAGHDVKAIALSGHASPDDVRRTRAAGFFAHLRKPLDVGELERTIRAAAAGPGAFSSIPRSLVHT